VFPREQQYFTEPSHVPPVEELCKRHGVSVHQALLSRLADLREQLFLVNPPSKD